MKKIGFVFVLIVLITALMGCSQRVVYVNDFVTLNRDVQFSLIKNIEGKTDQSMCNLPKGAEVTVTRVIKNDPGISDKVEVTFWYDLGTICQAVLTFDYRNFK